MRLRIRRTPFAFGLTLMSLAWGLPAQAGHLVDVPPPYTVGTHHSCDDMAGLSSCSVDGSITEHGSLDLRDRLVSPAGGEAPGNGQAQTILTLATSFTHDDPAEAINVQAKFHFDNASVINHGRHANNELLRGSGGITLHMEAWQDGICCMGFHSQAVVLTPGTGHIGGGAPSSIVDRDELITVSVATLNGAPLPPGRVNIRIQLWSELRLNTLGRVPQIGDLESKATGNVASVVARVFH